MTEEQKILDSWTPDYTNDAGEEFYTKSKVAIILSEHRQNGVKNVSSNSCVSGSYSEKNIDDAYNKGFKDAMIKYRTDL